MNFDLYFIDKIYNIAIIKATTISEEKEIKNEIINS